MDKTLELLELYINNLTLCLFDSHIEEEVFTFREVIMIEHLDILDLNTAELPELYQKALEGEFSIDDSVQTEFFNAVDEYLKGLDKCLI